MAQGYYTLQEAAQILGIPVDELKQMAQNRKVRSFQDRGTLRFRVQDIQELARSRGATSDPEQAIGDASLPSLKAPAKKQPPSGSKKKAPLAPGPKTPPKQVAAPEVFDFDVDGDGDSVHEGDFLPMPQSAAKSKSDRKEKPLPAGSDSDVRLVPDGSDVTFSVQKDRGAKPPDSDVKVPSDPLKPKTNVHQPGSTSDAKRRSQLAMDSGTQPKSKGSASKQASPRPGGAPQPPDSGVRLVPMDSDSDVKLLGASDDVPLGESGPSGPSDSNVRLEKVELPPADSQEDNMMLTEEINLDEEIKKQQEKQKNEPSTKLKAKSALKLPTSSPFELSDSDLDLPSELKDSAGPKTPVKAESDQHDSSDFDLALGEGQKDDDSSDFEISTGPAKKEGSSDFDLVPAADGSVILEEENDLSLEASDENDVLLEEPTNLTSSSSGISLDNPADGGISLEEKKGDDDSSDFDLSLEAEDTPKPQRSKPMEDSDSEFELKAEKTPKPQKKAPKVESSDDIDLSLDVDDAVKEGDDSEFELNLDGSGEGDAEAAQQSDSEFELTLDDSGNIAVEEEPKPQVKSKKKPASDDEQDIFDTDFDVPALEESDDAAVADSELESSDFDIALDDSDLANEEESGSQVVALDEESETDTVTEDDEGAVVDDVEVEEESSDFSDLDQDVEVSDDDAGEVEVDEDEEGATAGPGRTVVKEKLIPPAPWGVMPVIFMLPCVIIMFLVGILGYEMVQASAGLKPPGPLTTAIAGMFGDKVTLK